MLEPGELEPTPAEIDLLKSWEHEWTSPATRERCWKELKEKEHGKEDHEEDQQEQLHRRKRRRKPQRLNDTEQEVYAA